MKNRFKYSAAIERYLSDEMEYAEMRSFEKEIASNPVLSAELELTRNIDKALRCDDVIDFRQKMTSANKDNKIPKLEMPIVHLRRYKYWLVAASFVLLAALGSVIYLNASRGPSNDELFNSYYTSENMINVTRSGDANIVEAIIKFQEKDYKSSSRLFSQILVNDSSNFAGWFFYGISCIETGDFNKAESAFQYIIADNQNLYTEHAGWYLALSYLKSNQSNKAKKQLQIIAADPENFHRSDARHLLEKLEE
jgi:hypothetical protein